VNGQQLIGTGSRFSFVDQGRQATIEFQADFAGEFDQITVTRRERATSVDEGPRRSGARPEQGLAAADAVSDPSAGLLAEVDRLLAFADGDSREAEQETFEPAAVGGSDEAASQAEIVRQQFAAIAREGYFGAGGLDVDGRLAQLKGLVDLLA
jgi:hypothetical protein